MMMTIKEYMTEVGVSNRKYVQEWIEQDLIPGVIKGDSLEKTQFPDSARRPYRNRWLRAGISADKIRAHIVKACLERKHITKKIFKASDGEFNGFIHDLINAGLIRKRVEDGIDYYDSTIMCDSYRGKALIEIKKFVIEAIEATSKGISQGTTEALLTTAI